MSSKLQLDVCCLSCCGGAIWWTLTKERQAWCYMQVKLCDPRLSAFCVLYPGAKRCYINTFPFLSFPSILWLQTHGQLTKAEHGSTAYSRKQSHTATHILGLTMGNYRGSHVTHAYSFHLTAFFSTYYYSMLEKDRKENPSGITKAGFLQATAVPATQPIVSKHWRKLEAVTARKKTSAGLYPSVDRPPWDRRMLCQ